MYHESTRHTARLASEVDPEEEDEAQSAVPQWALSTTTQSCCTGDRSRRPSEKAQTPSRSSGDGGAGDVRATPRRPKWAAIRSDPLRYYEIAARSRLRGTARRRNCSRSCTTAQRRSRVEFPLETFPVEFEGVCSMRISVGNWPPREHSAETARKT